MCTLAGGVPVCVCVTVGWVMHVALACWHMCICMCVCARCFESKHPVHRACCFAVFCVVMMYEYCVFSQQKHEGLLENVFKKNSV